MPTPVPKPKPQDQPDPDAQILQGGPGETPLTEERPKPSDAPSLVTVKYGGKDYTVAPEIAEAWSAREKEFGQKISEQGTELGSLRKFRQSVEQTVTPPRPTGSDLGTLLFENPNEAISQIRQGIIREVEGRYSQDQSQREFWRGFYRKHDDLDGEDTLVQAVMQRHWGELETLPVSTAQDKIADLTRGEILRISKKLKGGREDELPQGRAVVEGASSTPSRRKAEPEPEGPKSLSDVIRANRARRLQPTPAKG